jgi:hypothetical protein
VGLKYRIRLLICGFLVVSTGDLVLADESAEDCCAVDSVLGEVDGAWWSVFGLRWAELVQGAVGPVLVVVLQVAGEGSAQVPFVDLPEPWNPGAAAATREDPASHSRAQTGRTDHLMRQRSPLTNRG